MTIGAEIPFRRSRFARGTGSLILDRQREEHQRQTDHRENPMRVWSKGRFVPS
ncbi:MULTISPECIES: hypothetical protein [Novosphingobium]|jgi:hypothetical protein|uniref:Uncharacterized protein n=1 Tax=Novosphingobium panipatense TaxID=428991 RepID=A0ABY1PX59_9SPHN|nr:MULTISPECIES: hypothetical protein [Novosphingobium]SMP51792.1 hypothetical protein SAMN06296065_101178 [Novosphingobium panipatense]